MTLRSLRRTNYLYMNLYRTSVFDFEETDVRTEFEVEGFEDTQITLELEAEQEYEVLWMM